MLAQVFRLRIVVLAVEAVVVVPSVLERADVGVLYDCNKIIAYAISSTPFYL